MDSRAVTDAEDGRRQAAPEPESASEFCPVCAARLEPRRCKLTCPRCGYYMSCSDYY